MNYYIQGNKDNADKIKAAFEAKAIYSNLTFANKNYLYYSCDGKVAFCFIGGGLANIIKTHPDYKELELPVEPKFKVGDKVIYGGKERTITFIDDKFYDFDGGCAGCRIELQDGPLRPVPKPHFDIANFKPFDKVLVRDRNSYNWRCAWFSHYDKTLPYPFITTGADYRQCIPFEGNEHLLGTTDMPSEEYINW